MKKHDTYIESIYTFMYECMSIYNIYFCAIIYIEQSAMYILNVLTPIGTYIFHQMNIYSTYSFADEDLYKGQNI